MLTLFIIILSVLVILVIAIGLQPAGSTVTRTATVAIVQDPAGARIGLWQAARHQGAGLDDTPGTVCWHDLNTPKSGAAANFYAQVFGWKTQAMGEGDKAYRLFKLGRAGAGGL
jgi:predicted enzyme related to lactoylglutathione lyase